MNLAVKFLGSADNPVDTRLAADPLWNHRLADNTDFVNLILGIMSTGIVSMSTYEAINLYRLVERVSRLEGNIAELGSYQGGSAGIIALANKSKKKIRLFDTFSGITGITQGVDKVQEGDFATPGGVEEVKTFLNHYMDSIVIHQGSIPKTLSQIPAEETFSLVNLDLDIYQPTLEGLRFFYDKMTPGGVIVVHDYHSKSCPGVKAAVDEFFFNKKETIIDLWHTQVVVAKM